MKGWCVHVHVHGSCSPRLCNHLAFCSPDVLHVPHTIMGIHVPNHDTACLRHELPDTLKQQYATLYLVIIFFCVFQTFHSLFEGHQGGIQQIHNPFGSFLRLSFFLRRLGFGCLLFLLNLLLDNVILWVRDA